MLRVAIAILLLVDGTYSLTRNERAEHLKETVQDLLGEHADHYLVAALLGLGEVALGLRLLMGSARR